MDMWICQGTVTHKRPDGEISPQFPTFYLHPEVQGIESDETAHAIACDVLNPTDDPNIIPNVYVNLVSVESVCEPAAKEPEDKS